MAAAVSLAPAPEQGKQGLPLLRLVATDERIVQHPSHGGERLYWVDSPRRLADACSARGRYVAIYYPQHARSGVLSDDPCVTVDRMRMRRMIAHVVRKGGSLAIERVETRNDGGLIALVGRWDGRGVIRLSTWAPPGGLSDTTGVRLTMGNGAPSDVAPSSKKRPARKPAPAPVVEAPSIVDLASALARPVERYGSRVVAIPRELVQSRALARPVERYGQRAPALSATCGDSTTVHTSCVDYYRSKPTWWAYEGNPTPASTRRKCETQSEQGCQGCSRVVAFELPKAGNGAPAARVVAFGSKRAHVERGAPSAPTAPTSKVDPLDVDVVRLLARKGDHGALRVCLAERAASLASATGATEVEIAALARYGAPADLVAWVKARVA